MRRSVYNPDAKAVEQVPITVTAEEDQLVLEKIIEIPVEIVIEKVVEKIVEVPVEKVVYVERLV